MNHIGLDADEVNSIANKLEMQASILDGVTLFVDTVMGHLGSVWQGPDLLSFHHLWDHGHRSSIASASAEVAEWVTELRRQVISQQLTSGVDGSGSRRSLSSGQRTERPRGETAESKKWTLSLLDLSDDSYGDASPGTVVGKHSPFTVVTQIHTPDGYSATVYSYARPDGSTAYVVAFRGSEGGVGGVRTDWMTDVQDGLGLPTRQYQHAADLGRQLAEEYGAENVTFTGHSLGGGLAQVASISSGAPAIVFNSARPGEGAIDTAVARNAGTPGSVTALYSSDDPLNQWESGLGINARGHQVRIESHGDAPGSGHSLQHLRYDVENSTHFGQP